MATVLNSKAKIFRRHTFDDEEPSTHLESDVNSFLKKLSSKQLDTNLTIEKHLLDEKEFVHSIEVQLPTVGKALKSEKCFNTADGTSNATKQIGRENYKSGNGNWKTQSENIVEALHVDTDSYDNTQSISNNAFMGIDAHKFDRQLSPYELPRTILRHRRQLLDSDREPFGPFQTLQFKRKKCSFADVKCTLSKPSTKVKTVEFKSSKQFTISRNAIIPLQKSLNTPEKFNATQKFEPGHSFIAVAGQSYESPKYSTRITEEQIRGLPKFRNYEAGVPSKVLYLKNISGGVNEEDLISIFNKYEKSDQTKIVYRLMKKGRMRGQGFVRFPCIETAVNALKETNGTIVKDKPIIMMYSDSDTRDE